MEGNLVLHPVTSGARSQHIWISTSSFMSLQLPRVICRVKKKKSFIHVGTCMSSVVLFFAMGFHVGAQIHCQENNGPFIPAFGQHY